ncbi:MAG: adaptor protein MecA [Oscillospiraceae bacterium]
MKIEATSKNTLVISLSCQDMQELGITYEDMDYNSIDTRRVIYTLLQKANLALNKDIHPSGKMVIEAVPDTSGGCVLYFTVYQIDADRDEVFPTAMPFICVSEFKDENELIDASRAIMSCFLSPPESKLYSNGTRYRVVFNGMSNHRKLKSVLTEYCEDLSESKAKIAQTKEHWRCLCDSRAIEHLGTS